MLSLCAWLCLLSGCGNSEEPSSSFQGTVTPIRTDYASYLGELHELETSLHSDTESIALRRKWVTHFIPAMRAQVGPTRLEAASTALLLLLNLGRFSEDWAAVASQAYAVAEEALQYEPSGASASETCVWIEDIAIESHFFREGEALLSDIATRTRDPLVRSTALMSLAQVRYEREDLREAALALGEIVESGSGSTEVARALGLLSEIEGLQLGQVVETEDVVGVNGDVAALSESRGQWVWIEFYSVACGACSLDAEAVGELNAWLLDHDVAVYSIEVKSEGSPRVDRDGRARGILVATDHPVVTRFNVLAVPRNFVLDPEGRLAAKDLTVAQGRDYWAPRVGSIAPPAQSR